MLSPRRPQSPLRICDDMDLLVKAQRAKMRTNDKRMNSAAARCKRSTARPTFLLAERKRNNGANVKRRGTPFGIDVCSGEEENFANLDCTEQRSDKLTNERTRARQPKATPRFSADRLQLTMAAGLQPPRQAVFNSAMTNTGVAPGPTLESGQIDTWASPSRSTRQSVRGSVRLSTRGSVASPPGDLLVVPESGPTSARRSVTLPARGSVLENVLGKSEVGVPKASPGPWSERTSSPITAEIRPRIASVRGSIVKRQSPAEYMNNWPSTFPERIPPKPGSPSTKSSATRPDSSLVDTDEDERPSSNVGSSAPRQVAGELGGGSELWKLAVQLKIPHDLLMTAYDHFKEFAMSETERRRSKALGEDIGERFDLLTEGRLNHQQFTQVLMKITGAVDSKELPPGLCLDAFSAADVNDTSSLDFVEFALWFSRHGFSEEVLLTREQRQIRQIARTYNLPHSEVEAYKRKFDSFDTDDSGMIEYDEFEKLLRSLLKVPQHLELPASRVRQLWTQIDVDKSGQIEFEEFLVFYDKFFNIREMGHGACPLEEFYRIRPNAMRNL